MCTGHPRLFQLQVEHISSAGQSWVNLLGTIVAGPAAYELCLLSGDAKLDRRHHYGRKADMGHFAVQPIISVR
jgi:hypothetical protein